MFSLQLLSTKKNKNSTASGGVALCLTQVELKSDTSIIRPTFELDMSYNGMTDGSTVIKANYAYCVSLSRYYWIKDIVFTSADIVEITCVVDPLASFRSYLLNSEAYINYASKNYNALIPDRRLPMQIKHTASYRQVQVTGLSDSGVFILFAASDSVSGATGLVQGYVCSATTMSAIAANLFSSDVLDKIIDKLYSPLDAIMSCMWLPCSANFVTSGAGEMKFGEYVAGTYPRAAVTAVSTTQLVAILPYKDPESNSHDWRNIAPYTRWFIWLPGVGYQEFPMELCLNGSGTQVTLNIKLQLSITNGSCSYTITCNNTIVMQCKGNLGVNFPVGHSNNGLDGAVNQSVGVASSLGIAALVPNPVTAIGAVATAGTAAVGAGAGMIQHSISASGAMGGLATPSELRNYVRLYYTCSEFPEDPFGDLANLIGCPVFKHATLSEYLDSKVWCSNINFKWNADFAPTEDEYNMIIDAFTSQDGIWIQYKGDL